MEQNTRALLKASENLYQSILNKVRYGLYESDELEIAERYPADLPEDKQILRQYVRLETLYYLLDHHVDILSRSLNELRQYLIGLHDKCYIPTDVMDKACSFGEAAARDTFEYVDEIESALDEIYAESSL